MKRLGSAGTWLVVVGLILPFLWTAPVAAQDGPNEPDHEFTIAVGETLTLSAGGIREVMVGDSDVAGTTHSADGRYLFIRGRRPGISTFTLVSGRGDERRTILVRVVGINPTALAEEVRQVLGEGAGVDIRVVKGRVLIEGEVSSEIFQRKIDRLVELYPDQVLNFATYREAFVEGARMVALDIYFIQMALTNSDNLGVRWNQFIGYNMSAGSGEVPLYYTSEELGPGVLPGEDGSQLPRPIALTGGESLTTYSSLVGNLNFALDLLVEKGLIKTIQQATLVTEAGTHAEYLSGGSILIPFVTADTTGTEEHRFGLELEILPILDFENRVKLEIYLRYREVDFSLGDGTNPGFRSTEVTSTVNMMEGQSVLISAQENTDRSSLEQGFWLLSSIPILGWAFKSRNFLSEEQNNALFITPRVYEPGTDHHREMVQAVFQSLLDGGAHADDLPELQDAE